MDDIDFLHISRRNGSLPTQRVSLANGATFRALVMSHHDTLKASNALYLHVHRDSRKCYVGITIQEAGKRWHSGIAYQNNRRFGHAVRKHGWEAFDSYILALADDRADLLEAEVAAIAAAGGHKTKYTYNLTPGGDLVAENDKPIVGVFLATGETRMFKSGAEAARALGLKNADMPMAVARGKRVSAAGWWFRFAGDRQSRPPETWGEVARISEVRKRQAKKVIGVRFETGEERVFESTAAAAATLGVNQSAVVAIANGDGYSAKGWWFKYDGDGRDPPLIHGSAATRKKRDKKVFALHLSTGERRVFRNCTSADEELGIYLGASASVASGERMSAAGWWFSYSETSEAPAKHGIALLAEKRSKAITAMCISTGETASYPSAKLAAVALGISRAAISLVLNGKRESAKGYVFNFAE